MKRIYPGTLGRPSQGSRGKNSGKVVEREFFPLKQLRGAALTHFITNFSQLFLFFLIAYFLQLHPGTKTPKGITPGAT